MYKVKEIAEGMIVWNGGAVIGIKGLTLPEIFDDCNCIKLPGNAYDYSLAPNNKYTEEQLAFIQEAEAEWADADNEEIGFESDYGHEYHRDEDSSPGILCQYIPDEDLFS
jgi:hypothetical protein